MLKSNYLTEHDLKDFGFKSIGKNVRISSDARIYGQENISIGNDVRIDDFVIFSAASGTIEIGSCVFIARGCHLSGTFGIQIRDFSTMAANTIVYSASDDYTGRYLTGQAIPSAFTTRIGGPVVIEKHVIVGSSCTIIGSCIIREGCSIGSMTLVNEDLEAWGIYVGIPARRLKDRSKDLLKMEQEFIRLRRADY
jgi:galactoside O-acetyltransferase